jgi:hypothetical protein
MVELFSAEIGLIYSRSPKYRSLRRFQISQAGLAVAPVLLPGCVYRLVHLLQSYKAAEGLILFCIIQLNSSYTFNRTLRDTP